MLTMALILTTLALPVSAANISFEDYGNLTIGYSMSYPEGQDAMHPGEEFDVYVNVTASSENVTSFTTGYFNLTYDSDVFEYKLASDYNSKATVDGSKAGNVRFDYEDINNSLVLANNKASFVKLTFAVKDTAIASESAIFALDNTGDAAFTVPKDDSFVYFNAEENNLKDDKLTVTVKNNTAKALINGTEIENGKTYYSTTGVKVTYEATNFVSATIQKDNGEATNIDANGTQVTEAGTYTVVVKAKGNVETTYTFTLSTANVQAKLSLDGTVQDSGYKYNDEFTFDVKISGLDGATADMVSFDVVYDTEKFNLALVGENVELKYNNTVMFGDKNGNLTTSETDKAQVVGLKFTVKENIAYGDYEIKIENAKMALAKDAINPEADNIGIENGTKAVTVVPADSNFVTASGGKTDWGEGCNGDGYALTLTSSVEQATLKYKAVSETTAPTLSNQEELKTFYDGATEVFKNTMMISTEETYYVVAKIGSVYFLTNTLVNGTDVFYDGTAPIVDATKVAMSDWAKEKTINVSDITANDVLSGVGKYYVSKAEIPTENDYTEITASNGYKFTETFEGNVTIKVTDKAGNSATATAAIKVDMDIPTATITGGAQSNGKKELVVTASDDKSGVKSKEVTYSAEENGEYATKVEVEQVDKYYANQSGWYKLTVTDNAGNVSEAKVQISIDKITGASAINVTVVKNGTAVKNGFLTKEAMTSKGIQDRNGNTLSTNGTFTYVKITVDTPADSEKYENKVYVKDLSSDSSEFVEETDGVVELDKTNIGNYEVKVVTVNKSDTTDKAEAVYEFSVVAPDNMLSVNADGRYNIIDYAYIMKVVGSSVDGALPTSTNGFWGGLLSGDLTGDLTLKSDDLTMLINSIRAGETRGSYNSLAIMNILAQIEPVPEN